MPELKLPGPDMRDWLLLSVGVVFIAMGLVILPSDHQVGVVILTFVCPCAAFFACNIQWKRRFSTKLSGTPTGRTGTP